MAQFVHLHVHTEYSLLDGAARISELVAAAKADGQPALAITDHGAMYGVVAFYKECVKQGIKPIIGTEAYMAPRSMEEKEGRSDKEYSHLVLLAKNQTGYSNLCKLSTLSFTKGKYYKPRIDYQVLEKYKEGLIAMSACLSGDLPRLLMAGRDGEALAYVKRMQVMFGEDFYIELQNHNIPVQLEILPKLLDICEKTGVKPVCTNDVHYVNQQDAEAQDVLLCIQTGKFVSDSDRMRMEGNQFYLKTEEQMAKLFALCPQSLTNTLEVAEKCDVQFEFGKIHLPSYDVPQGTNLEYLTGLCHKGLEEKLPDCGEEYHKRLEFELNVIANMGYTDYFLIVWDFIHFAKGQGIAVGPGRGSAAGSLAAYCLDITGIDPIKYGLLFERFLNPERVSMPDIDIDFCYVRRQEVIDYVVSKYGEDRVAQIITFGTMAARAAIRDVGRVLSVPYGEVDKLAKMVPQELGITLSRALQISADLKNAYDSGGDSKRILDLALKVEGIPRNASTHAAGVVICARPVVEYVPLQTNEDAVTTQYPMGIIEELGLLKMDFLGLRTLTVIQDTLGELARQGEALPELDNMEFADPEVYKLISSGDTDGVFQLESGGMRSFIQQLKPDTFEDIVAGIALYRPGPMDQIPRYVDCKFNPDHVKYAHPLLVPILGMTYGCIVYQEQVMQIVRDLAGYSLGHSDLVRRAMAKKKKEVMEKEKTEFIKGCLEHGVSQGVAADIFAQMMDFAQYAFNKSHAAVYAVIAYQTAYLKVHYPVEFMASLMNSFLGSTDKVSEYVYSCRQAGITLLPPDVNRSTERFTVEEYQGKKAIRFGLAAVKTIGIAACEQIAIGRESSPYADFYDFLERCDSYVTKRMVSFLIKAGVFDSFGIARSALMGMYEKAMDSVADKKKRNISGQLSLFDLVEGLKESVRPDYPPLPEFKKANKLFFEKEATGMYITGHPMEEYAEEARKLTTSKSLLEAGKDGSLKDEARVCVGGVVQATRLKLTRKNDKMAYATLEDMYSQFECVIFPKVLEKYGEFLETDMPIIICGRVNVRDEAPNVLIAEEIRLLEKGMDISAMLLPRPQEAYKQSKMAKQVKPGLYIRCAREVYPQAKLLVDSQPGDVMVVYVVDGRAAPSPGGCNPSAALVSSLEHMLDRENVKLVF